MTLFFLVSLFLAIVKGSIVLSFVDLTREIKDHHSLLWQIRIPRVMTACVCGALLALAGILMQLLLQNPLADPYILGVSSGAAFFTLLFMILNLPHLSLAPWIGSALTMLVILILSIKHRWHNHTLLLTGIALTFGFSAGISLLLLISNDIHLHSMLFWLTGDLSSSTFPWFGCVLVFFGYGLCHLIAPGLNILLHGEKEAHNLGLPIRRYQLLLYFIASFFTAEAVSLTGCIGFIGLIVPHLSRRAVGFDHRKLIPASFLIGSSLLMNADTLSRTLIAPEQLPVGILLTLLGVPFFLILILK